jgi:two-component system LytT family response regulator
MEAGSRSASIRVLIVDDEPLARRNLIALLRGDSEIASVEECDSGAAAVVDIQSKSANLVFLDVQMPEVNGFDVLEMLGTALPPAIIFVTAHDQYALRAFDVGALDYLLKPFDEARFRLALDRAKSKLREAGSGNPSRPKRFVVRKLGRIEFVPVSELEWIDAADYYVQLHTAGQTHLLRRALSEVERDLQGNEFCRIHRSTLVNLQSVRSLALQADGEYEAVLKSGVRLRVSRRMRKQLQERLGVTRQEQ